MDLIDKKSNRYKDYVLTLVLVAAFYAAVKLLYFIVSCMNMMW